MENPKKALQEVKEFREDGRHLVKVKESEMLIFFEHDSHYGVAVPRQ